MMKPAMQPNNVPFITGISDIAARYDYFILDIFGVIHDGIRSFPGTENVLNQLQRADKKICLLSNTPMRAEGTLEQLELMGLKRSSFNHIVTSGEATHAALKDLKSEFGKNCWFIGTDMMAGVLEGHDLTLVNGPENADFIINSVPGTHRVTRESFIHKLSIAAKRNVPMICANPDLVVNIGETQYECAGTFALEYEQMGGRVIYFGKPHLPVYERCHALFGKPGKSKIVAIGDSIHTDITGANRFGIDSVFNLEGIHQEEVRCRTSGQVDNHQVALMLKNQTQQPTYVMAGFQW